MSSDVHSVMPHGGSTRGGSLVTIAGSGFGTNVSDIEVDVNGIPCDVHSLNTTHISCWTGRPQDNDPSIAHEDGSYSVTDGGYRFRGISYCCTPMHSYAHIPILSYSHNTHSPLPLVLVPMTYQNSVIPHSLIFPFSHTPFPHTPILPYPIPSYSHSPIPHSPGSRGVSYRSYRGDTINNLESLHNHADYPNNPSRVGVYPSYSTEDAAK